MAITASWRCAIKSLSSLISFRSCTSPPAITPSYLGWLRSPSTGETSRHGSRMLCTWARLRTGSRCSRKLISVSLLFLLRRPTLTFKDPLAYLTAKSHGLEEECQSIIEATGLTEEQLTLPELGEPLT